MSMRFFMTKNGDDLTNNEDDHNYKWWTTLLKLTKNKDQQKMKMTLPNMKKTLPKMKTTLPIIKVMVSKQQQQWPIMLIGQV